MGAMQGGRRKLALAPPQGVLTLTPDHRVTGVGRRQVLPSRRKLGPVVLGKVGGGAHQPVSCREQGVGSPHQKSYRTCESDGIT